jgi:transcriptional regulator with XRE-family HTH domain
MLQKIVKNDIVKREDKTKDVQSKRLRLQKRKSGATPEGEIMAIFMENYKKYCKENGYKQKFVALKTGMSEAKVSRLFKGEQEANEQDMELLSKAFMKFPVFFMQEGFDEKIFTPETSAAEFYLGEAAGRMKEYTDKLIEFVECVDAILGIRPRRNAYKGE